MENVGRKHHLASALKDIYDKYKGTGAKYCGVYFWSSPSCCNLMRDIMIRDVKNFIDWGLLSIIIMPIYLLWMAMNGKISE